MKNEQIDGGRPFDFGQTAEDYAGYRDVYPQSMFDKLPNFGVGLPGQRILDVGTGTGVLPRKLAGTGAHFTGVDVSPAQIEQAKRLSAGMYITYAVAPAEQTGLPQHSFEVVTACQCLPYFDENAFAEELVRLLVPEGKFCAVSMMWLPFEGTVAAQMEELVLRYNPAWTGGGYPGMRYRYPAWAQKQFELETLHCYEEDIVFTKEAWRGRVRSCRGVGASLPPDEVQRFDAEYAEMLAALPEEELAIQHQIIIEVYRRKAGT